MPVTLAGIVGVTSGGAVGGPTDDLDGSRRVQAVQAMERVSAQASNPWIGFSWR